jgi:hypothetical protein
MCYYGKSALFMVNNAKPRSPQQLTPTMNPTNIILVSIIVCILALIFQHLVMRAEYRTKMKTARSEGWQEGDNAGRGSATAERPLHSCV